MEIQKYIERQTSPCYRGSTPSNSAAGDSSFRKAKNSYFLEFDDDNGFTARLDVNSCSGTYELIDSKNIKFDGMHCTYSCCDTEYAEDFARLLRVMTKYSKRGRKLILEGEGQIVLKRVE